MSFEADSLQPIRLESTDYDCVLNAESDSVEIYYGERRRNGSVEVERIYQHTGSIRTVPVGGRDRAVRTTDWLDAMHPSGVAKSSTGLIGWGKGGNVTSAGWQ